MELKMAAVLRGMEARQSKISDTRRDNTRSFAKRLTMPAYCGYDLIESEHYEAVARGQKDKATEQADGNIKPDSASGSASPVRAPSEERRFGCS